MELEATMRADREAERAEREAERAERAHLIRYMQSLSAAATGVAPPPFTPPPFMIPPPPPQDPFTTPVSNTLTLTCSTYYRITR